MICPDPKCDGLVTTVALTNDRGETIRRKRKCTHCGIYFWTEEKFLGYTKDTVAKMVRDITKDSAGLTVDDVRKAVDGIENAEYKYSKTPRGTVPQKPQADVGVIPPENDGKVKLRLKFTNWGG